MTIMMEMRMSRFSIRRKKKLRQWEEMGERMSGECEWASDGTEKRKLVLERLKVP